MKVLLIYTRIQFTENLLKQSVLDKLLRAVQLHVIHVYSGSHQMGKSKTTNQV